MIFPRLAHPIVQAPLSGGASTPELAAAVSGAGGLGFLAAGYTSASDLDGAIRTTRELTAAPFGVNVFVLEANCIDEAALDAYRQSLAGDAERLGATLGETRFDDDDLAAKVTVLHEGSVLAEGSVEHVQNHPRVVEVYLGR